MGPLWAKQAGEFEHFVLYLTEMWKKSVLSERSELENLRFDIVFHWNVKEISPLRAKRAGKFDDFVWYLTYF